MDSSNEKIQGTYSQIIKQLRGKAFLSQEKFASEIGFCPATLNRWEKGTKSPSFLSKQLLQSYCDKHNITIEIIERPPTLEIILNWIRLLGG